MFFIRIGQVAMWIDLQSLKEQVDLLALAGQNTALKRVASSGGGEWAGPCPFCGGQDRFRVQPRRPGGGRWLCRQCTDGKWQDALAFGQRLWPGLPFKEVCALLVGGSPPRSPGKRRSNRSQAETGRLDTPPAPENPAYQPPPDDWQGQALRAVEICERNLWSEVGSEGLAYLRGRGLQDRTIRHWRLGYSPGARFGGAALTGGAVSSAKITKALWVPRGVLIPCLALGEVWYLKIALLPGDSVRCEKCRNRTPARQPCSSCGALNKYRGVKGNRPAAIFGADDLPGVDLALFVEGEFDAMIAWQELNDVITVCTLGSATNRPDLATWGPYLAALEWVLAAYDMDAAGQRGAQALMGLSERVRLCPLPVGAADANHPKDINEYVLSGGQLWPWLKGILLELGIGG
jgi:DNA primase